MPQEVSESPRLSGVSEGGRRSIQRGSDAATMLETMSGGLAKLQTQYGGQMESEINMDPTGRSSKNMPEVQEDRLRAPFAFVKHRETGISLR